MSGLGVEERPGNIATPQYRSDRDLTDPCTPMQTRGFSESLDILGRWNRHRERRRDVTLVLDHPACALAHALERVA